MPNPAAALRSSRTKGPDPTRRYRCWQSCATPAGDVLKGEILAGTHPIVKAAFSNFVDHEAVPVRDEPSEYDHIVQTHDEREQTRKAVLEELARENPVRLNVELVRSTRDLILERHGSPPRPALLLKGSIVAADDPLAIHNANAFEPVR